jgi:hypothetical protein
MQIAIVGAGFTPEEADRLRRSLATFKKHGNVSDFRTRFLRGMRANGYDEDFAERCFSQIEGFGSLRLPRKPRGEFRASGLCLVMAEAAPPRHLRLRAAEFAAHGLLRPGPDRARRPRTRGGGAPRLHQPLPLGQRDGTDRDGRFGPAARLPADQVHAGGGGRLDRCRPWQRLHGGGGCLAPRGSGGADADHPGRGRRLRERSA